MRTYTLTNKALRLFRAWLLLAYLLLFFLCGVLAAFFFTAAAIAAGVLLTLGLLVWFWYLPRLVKSYRVVFTDEAVTMSRGFFIRRQYLLPCPRLIYAEKFSTPLSTLWGLRAARGQLTIPALDKPDVEDFLERLNQLGRQARREEN